jgi:hypothetical protein
MPIGSRIFFKYIIFEFVCCIVLDVLLFLPAQFQICSFVDNHMAYTTLHKVIKYFSLNFVKYAEKL